jgi:hypothetical protein
MSQQALLKRIVEALDEAGVPYMLTGSLASSLQGEPRATHDIDLVVDVSAADVGRVTRALSGPHIYLDERAVEDATRRRAMFSIIDSSSEDNADFWLLTRDRFDRERFARRVLVDALGLRVSVCTPEDMILMKLRWSAQAGGSEKQLNDALRVYELQAGIRDEDYLDEWAARLDMAAALATIRKQSIAG